MRQFEPGAGKNFFKVSLILGETLRNLAVHRIKSQGHVGIGHHGLATDAGVFHIHRHILFLDADRLPLVRACGRLLQPPVVAQQQLEVAVVPLGGVGGPGTLNTAGHGVAAHATAGVVHPAQALLMHIGAFGGRAQVGRVAVAMRLAHGVAASGQGHGFLVVHGHAGKGHAHVARRFERVGLAIHAFGVHVNEAHHHGGQRVFQIALAAVTAAFATALGQPFFFRTPVDVFFGVPDVFPAKGKAKGLEAHRFVGHVARQDDQIGPADFVAVFFLDRPQQTARFIEVAVVRPGIERRKTLVARTCAAPAIGNAVGARRVPGHADHQAAVVAPVGGPPGLAVGHQRLEVVLQCLHIEFFDFLAVVEVSAQRVGLGVVLVQDVQVQRFGPPVMAGCAGRRGPTVHDRALAPSSCAFVVHCFLLGLRAQPKR